MKQLNRFVVYQASNGFILKWIQEATSTFKALYEKEVFVFSNLRELNEYINSVFGPKK